MALKFEDMLERLGDQGRKAVLNTYRLYEDGLIDLETFQEVAAELLHHITDQGAAYGSLSYENVRAFMLEQAPRDTALRSLASTPQEQGKISQALATITGGDPETILTRLERLGYVLPIESTQEGYAAALRGDPAAQGWQRGLNVDACEMCHWWNRDGRIWPKAHPMPTHKGCKCQQIPKIGEIQPTEYTRKMERRQRAIENRDRRSAEVRALIQQGEL